MKSSPIATRHPSIRRRPGRGRVSAPRTGCGGWIWREPDLNRRHRDFQSRALPTELPRRSGTILPANRRQTPGAGPATRWIEPLAGNPRIRPADWLSRGNVPFCGTNRGCVLFPDTMVQLGGDGVHADSVGRRVDPPATRSALNHQPWTLSESSPWPVSIGHDRYRAQCARADREVLFLLRFRRHFLITFVAARRPRDRRDGIALPRRRMRSPPSVQPPRQRRRRSRR